MLNFLLHAWGGGRTWGLSFGCDQISTEAQVQGLNDDALKTYNYKHLHAIIVDHNNTMLTQEYYKPIRVKHQTIR
jgi:hypothetical protein